MNALMFVRPWAGKEADGIAPNSATQPSIRTRYIAPAAHEARTLHTISAWRRPLPGNHAKGWPASCSLGSGAKAGAIMFPLSDCDVTRKHATAAS